MGWWQKIACISVLLIAASCSPFGYTYVNPLPDTAAYTHGGQIRATGTVGVLGTHAQVSASPIKYVGITGGYFYGYKGFTSYNFSGQLYAPVFKARRAGRFYVSLQAERAHGRQKGNFTDDLPFVKDDESNIETDVSYTATSITPSVYSAIHVGKKEWVKIGLSVMFTRAVYDNFYFKQTYLVSGQPFAKGDKDINAPNTVFTGTGAWMFFIFESKKVPVFAYTNFGFAPDNYNANKIDMQNLQRNYRFAPGFVNFTTFGLYLDWKKYSKSKAAQ